MLLVLALAGAVGRFLADPSVPPGAVGVRLGRDARPEATADVTAESARAGRPLAPGERIDLDRASASELVRLPGVGTILARRIVQDREERGPFGTLEVLGRVRGVGPTLLGRIRPHIAVASGGNLQGRFDPTKVSLNTAPVAVLEQLPGIGPARARAIVEDRRRNGPYSNVDDLRRVRGIGAATVDRLRSLVTVR